MRTSRFKKAKFEAWCLMVKSSKVLAKWHDGELTSWDRMNLHLLSLQCDLGLMMKPEEFLLIIYCLVICTPLMILGCMCRCK